MNKEKNNYTMDLIITVISFIGLLLNFSLFKNPVGLLYYTIFSNLLCFIFYLYSLIIKIKKRCIITRRFVKIKGLVLLSLICTFLIYNFFMVPSNQVNAYDGHFFVSCFVHIFTPLLVSADCLLNGKNNMLEYKDLYFYFIVMVLYGFVIIIYQNLGGMFPGGTNYPYLNFDVNDYGYFKCFIANIVIVTIYELLGLMIIFINRKIVKKN